MANYYCGGCGIKINPKELFWYKDGLPEWHCAKCGSYKVDEEGD